MDIYIKPIKKVRIVGKEHIILKDIAEIYAPKEIMSKLNTAKIVTINNKKSKNYLVSIMDLIKKIQELIPNATVVNVGEIDTIIDYKPKESLAKKPIEWFKIMFVCIVLLTGSATAIMSFHTDAQIPTIFRKYYNMLLKDEKYNPRVIDLSYSIGLAVGIVTFFNHIGGKKLTDDPTPIQVEMSLYDNDVTDTLIETLSKEKSD